MMSLSAARAQEVTSPSSQAQAQQAPEQARTNGAELTRELAKELDTWEKTALVAQTWLEGGSTDETAVADLRQTIEGQRLAAKTRLEALQKQLEPLGKQREDFKAAAEQEQLPPELKGQQEEIERRWSALRAQVAQVEFALNRATNLAEELADRQRRIFTQQIFHRGSGLFEPATWRGAAKAWPSFAHGLGMSISETAGSLSVGGWALLIAALGLIAFALWRHDRGAIGDLSDLLIARAQASTSKINAMLLGAALLMLRIAPAAMAAALITRLADKIPSLSQAGHILITQGASAILVIAFAYGLSRTVFAPRVTAHRVFDMGTQGGLKASALICGIVALVAFRRAILNAASADGTDLSLMAIFNFAVMILAAPMIFRLAQLRSTNTDAQPSSAAPDGAAEPEEDVDTTSSVTGLLRILALAVSIFLPITAALGYFALSGFVLERTTMTAALMVACTILFVIARRLMEHSEDGSSDEGKLSSQGALAAMLIGLVLFVLAIPVFLYIWGASGTDIQVAAQRLSDGIKIGETRFSPTDMLIALAVFIFGLWVTRLLQSILRRSVLPNMHLDQGVQTSLSAGLGYIGFFLTALLTISAVGLDLSNLAIVAGALSVGIGFGLQTIVNNFVSGLILLVERPVKVGDWIVVAGAEGYVRRINVRSTEIETFDRSSVIVPNSDLISSHVTNWTHKNNTGRVTLKIGVAYDSDPVQVHEILRDVASRHPMVLRYPQPLITFAGFGDSALDFEVRAYLRDVSYMLSVRSDLNHAIFKRFKEEGIEIPFPQRDLNLRNPDALRAVLLGAQEPGAQKGAETAAEPQPEPLSDPEKPI
ncbi:MAG: DUF3772 domain-containing protein [Neomegalonema sp.]|nr:DUF3772 domain-containing protein [Neomegalonema sp.]